jgi:hypothetical protein
VTSDRSTAVAGPARPHLNDAQRGWLLAALLCYAVGYPLALTASPAVGWTLVTVGGVCLLVLGVITIRRITRNGGDAPAAASPRDGVTKP